jgi:hypothetical protein
MDLLGIEFDVLRTQQGKSFFRISTEEGTACSKSMEIIFSYNKTKEATTSNMAADTTILAYFTSNCCKEKCVNCYFCKSSLTDMCL